MFLNQLEQPYKKLFAEIMCLLAIADGKADGIASLQEPGEIWLTDFIHPAFINAIDSYANELADVSALDDALHDSREGSLQKAWENSANKVLDEYADNKALRQEIWQKIMDSGIDIREIKPDMVTATMINTSELKKLILNETLHEILHAEKVSAPSYQQGKILLFEWVGFCVQSSGILRDEPKSFLQKVCLILGIDPEYIDEFSHAITQFFDANQKIHILMNE